jgi:hypothetical protein
MHENNGSGGTCLFCDRPATSTWRSGGNVVAVCEECATTALPALIADSIFIPKEHGADALKRKARQVMLYFWRAAALRLAEGKR